MLMHQPLLVIFLATVQAVWLTCPRVLIKVLHFAMQVLHFEMLANQLY